ncbi:MAG: exonuclease SbcCD subunit D [Candidatus Bathyarchaeota archaeon]|nr:exonuclease SbcCD subunit D [Candidatus Bathyarchaeota archaeon]
MRFAHLADCHLGANRAAVLRELEAKAFHEAMRRCVEAKVDFILIAGDLFHVNIPDMTVVNGAAKILREVADAGVPVYVVYGSHDFSPNQTAIIDVFESAGLLRKVTRAKVVDGKIKLEYTVDKRTGVKIAGLSARKGGLEQEYFKRLDADATGQEGFKIFMFHSAISEYKPLRLREMSSIPLSHLPRGYSYYAAGHVHQRAEIHEREYGLIVYPGVLFASSPIDLEMQGNGVKPGFYIVDFDGEVKNVSFQELDLCSVVNVEVDVSNLNSQQALTLVLDKLEKLDVKGKIVMVKIHGKLAGGRVSDVSSSVIVDAQVKRGALHVYVNRNQLSAVENSNVKLGSLSVQAVEAEIFKLNIGKVNISDSKLQGEEGIQTAQSLLALLRQSPLPNESKTDYEARLKRDALKILGVEG